jgi:protein TonB
MSYQFKGIKFSFVIHALVFVAIALVSGSDIYLSKPIVIDFGIVSPVRKEPSNWVSSQKTESRIQKTEMKRHEESTETNVFNTRPSPEAQMPVSAAIPSEHNNTKSKNDTGNLPAREKADTASLAKGVETAAVSGNAAENVRAKYLKEHFVYIRDIIMKNLSYPHVARKMGWEGKVVISFIISADGYVKDIKITESSGIQILDKNAIEAVKNAVPFPKPPVEAHMIIPVKYSLR